MKLREGGFVIIVIIAFAVFAGSFCFKKIRDFVDDGDPENTTLLEEFVKEDGILEDGTEEILKHFTGQEVDFSDED